MRDKSRVNANTAAARPVLDPFLPGLHTRDANLVKCPVVIELTRRLDEIARVGESMGFTARDDAGASGPTESTSKHEERYTCDRDLRRTQRSTPVDGQKGLCTLTDGHLHWVQRYMRRRLITQPVAYTE